MRPRASHAECRRQQLWVACARPLQICTRESPSRRPTADRHGGPGMAVCPWDALILLEGEADQAKSPATAARAARGYGLKGTYYIFYIVVSVGNCLVSFFTLGILHFGYLVAVCRRMAPWDDDLILMEQDRKESARSAAHRGPEAEELT